ncbi:hypothetical protein [Deinococcus aquatilis]|jgi:uncharacterized repeat protein (TIGR01451 family)|uniref:hypothetical protein n=1 Tax=Deinococcus aquatilis TaxID=519440 RepID=UPI00037A5C7E|nr:hypothetical protein [Deinococcus aquatilis]
MKKLFISTILALSSAAFAAGTPSGSTISNTGLFEFTEANGTSTPIPTTPVDITVASVYQPSITPDGTVANPGQTAMARPGETATLVYQVTNSGNATDTINLTVTNAQGGAPLAASIYLDNNNDGVVNAGDTLVTSLVGLNADETRQVLVQYTVPANTTGGASTYVNLTGTSAGNTASVDNNNVGEIAARNILRFTLASDNTVTAAPGVTTIITHTLTNTGNTTLSAATLVFDATAPVGYAVSYTVTNSSTGQSSTSTVLQTAVTATGDLDAGDTYSIKISYTPAANTPDGVTIVHSIAGYINFTDTVGTDNQVEFSQVRSNTDTLNVKRGVASVGKVADNCGDDATCADPLKVILNTPNAKPGDYVRYTVSVLNTGTAGLAFPTLRDYVPQFTSFASVTGSTSQSGAKVVFSSDRTNWNIAAPTTLATTTNPANGPFVFVGLDGADAGDSVTTADELAPGESMKLVIIVKVN